MSGEAGVGAVNAELVLTDDVWGPMGSRLSPDLEAINEDMGTDSDNKAAGRVSAASLAIIKEEFVEVQNRAKAVAEKTGLSPARVLQYWSTITTRTHLKRNAWNLYNSYFSAYEDEELSRLPERKSTTFNREVFVLKYCDRCGW